MTIDEQVIHDQAKQIQTLKSALMGCKVTLQNIVNLGGNVSSRFASEKIEIIENALNEINN